MNIKIKYTNLNSSAALNDYINEKIGGLEKYLKKFDAEGAVISRIEIARTTKHHHKGDIFRAEINLQLPGKLLRAEQSDLDVRIAVDMVKDKLHREIVKYKERYKES